jgi:hypothetical protein
VFHQKCPAIVIYHQSIFPDDSAGQISIFQQAVFQDKAEPEFRYRSLSVFEVAALTDICPPVCDVISLTKSLLFVLSYVIPASPPKEPPSLNCTCVSLPPGLPPPPPVAAIVTVPALPLHPVVRVILDPSMSCTLPPLAESVTV